METLKYCKVRKVKSPIRAHAEDAGIDFHIPENIDEKTFVDKCDVTKCYPATTYENGFLKSITLAPSQSVLIPSGIHVKIPHGYALIYMNKSGVASKKHLHVGACVVDENYQGECHLNLTNTGDCNITIEAGDKIVQGLVLPINYCQTEEMSSLEELYKDGLSDRGSGGFGSSGTK